MENKPTVLIIENSVDVTGALKSITQVAFHLKDDFEFQFIIPKKSKGRFWIEGRGLKNIYEFPMKEIRKQLLSVLLYFPFLFLNAIRLNQLTKRNGISIIHVNDIYNLLPVVMRLLGNTTPYVCQIRFLPDKFPVWLFNFWFKLHLRYSEKIIVVSESTMRMLPSREKVVVIHDELPERELYPEMTKSDNEQTSFTFLYLSNFVQGKGQDHAIEAFAKIHQDLPKWRLRFVGGDLGLKKNREYREALHDRARYLQIYEKIDWLGFTEDVEMEYKRADVVLNFSESESFSMTCLEALYFGRPLIATDCGGPSEMIIHENNGVLVPNRDIGSMLHAMRRLALDELARQEFSVKARQSVRKKFSKENTSQRINFIYKSALKK